MHHFLDYHYFPKLRQLDTRLERGFDILDKDHQALDAVLNRFAEGANGVLAAITDDAAMHEATGKFLTPR